MIAWLKKIFFATPSPSPKKKNARILIIDDDRTTCRLIQTALTRKGYDVAAVHTGQEGITAAIQQGPNLIFLDCLLPDINGIEVYKKIKAYPQASHIPVFFLTGVDTPKNIIDCYELGAENYLVKPISPKALVEQVEMSLKDYDLP